MTSVFLTWSLSLPDDWIMDSILATNIDRKWVNRGFRNWFQVHPTLVARKTWKKSKIAIFSCIIADDLDGLDGNKNKHPPYYDTWLSLHDIGFDGVSALPLRISSQSSWHVLIFFPKFVPYVFNTKYYYIFLNYILYKDVGNTVNVQICRI